MISSSPAGWPADVSTNGGWLPGRVGTRPRGGASRMATIGSTVIRLSDLQPDQEAECFAALVKKTRGMTKANQPYFNCLFRDKRVVLEAPIWTRPSLLPAGRRLGRGRRLPPSGPRPAQPEFGLQLEILDIRPAGREDAEDGYDFFDLVESSERPAAGDVADASGHASSAALTILTSVGWCWRCWSRTRRAVQPDAGGGQLPSQLHRRPAGARLEHERGSPGSWPSITRRTTRTSTRR